jgi:hypothetical protein
LGRCRDPLGVHESNQPGKKKTSSTIPSICSIRTDPHRLTPSIRFTPIPQLPHFDRSSRAWLEEEEERGKGAGGTRQYPPIQRPKAVTDGERSRQQQPGGRGCRRGRGRRGSHRVVVGRWWWWWGRRRGHVAARAAQGAAGRLFDPVPLARRGKGWMEGDGVHRQTHRSIDQC